MTGETDLLTVPEAAERLGVSIRTLRRILKRPEYESEVRQVQRQTKTGTRASASIPLALLPLLSQHFEKWENEGNGSIPNAAQTGANRGTATENDGTNEGASVALVRLTNERLLAEKDSRIAELTAALEHERGQNVRLLEALHREQSLRAIAPPQETAEQTTATEEAHAPARVWWQFWRR